MKVEGVSQGASVLLVGIVIAISFFAAVYMGAMGVLLPVLGAAFQMGTEAQGRLFPASFGGSMIGSLLSGYLSDRMNRKNIILICLGLGVLGLFCFSRATAFPIVLLAAALVGTGNSAAQMVGGALLSNLYAERRAVYLNGIQIGFGFGAIAGPLLAQWAQSVPMVGWRGFYLLLGLGQALLWILLALCPIPEKREEDGPGIDVAALRRLLQERPLLLLSLSSALYVGVEVAFFSWLPTYLGVIPGGAAFQGIAVSAFWVAMTVGRIGVGFLLGRVTLKNLQISLSVAATISSTLTLLSPTPILIMTTAALTGLSFSGVYSLLVAEGGERYPKTVGTALSLIYASCGVGSAFIPWLIGQLNGAGLPWAVALVVVPIGSFLVAALSWARPSSESESA